MPVLLPDREAWTSLVLAVSPVAAGLAEHFWPGPLSIALEARPSVDARLPLEGRLAVRVPGPCAAADLVTAFGRPLTATSANPPGAPPATSADGVRQSLPATGWFHVVEGESPGGSPSTVLVERGGRFGIAREGAVAAAALRAWLGSALDES
jgi:tRNA A37 threonylcarbamoyladenosine synthetase subunit TsaC/SUA5/YrdC